MTSEVESYSEFIVISESYKENASQEEADIKSDSKQPNTRKCQFVKLIEFSNVYNENNTGRDNLNAYWEKLTVELNEMGPPVRTTMQWRRVWSVYKYNSKKAEASSRHVSETIGNRPQSRAQGNRRSADQESVRERSRDQTCSPRNNSLQETTTDERILIQLRLMVQQNAKMIRNQETIIEKIDQSNLMLEKIAETNSKQN